MFEHGLTVSVLRELFRHLQAWRGLYETEGIDVLSGPDGVDYSLWDIETVYRWVGDLPPRQAQAIRLCLVENIRERDAAVRMGVSPTNPVAMYATAGLEKLVARAKAEVRHPTPSSHGGWLRCRSCLRVWTFSSQVETRRAIEEARKHHQESQCGDGRMVSHGDYAVA